MKIARVRYITFLLAFNVPIVYNGMIHVAFDILLVQHEQLKAISKIKLI